MALAKSALVAALTSAFTPSEDATPASAANAIADAIDLFIKTGLVSVTVSTVGTAAAQTGTGTGSIT